jgi:hypothetical protein
MLATSGMLCGGRLTVGSGAVSHAASYSSRGHLALNGSNEWNERYGVSPTISCHFQFGWCNRKRRASAAAEVGPDGRDGGRGGVRAAASKMGDTGEAVRKCIELPVIDRDAGRA